MDRAGDRPGFDSDLIVPISVISNGSEPAPVYGDVDSSVRAPVVALMLYPVTWNLSVT